MDDIQSLGHIGVLLGGISSEREISLKSGKAVYQAFKDKGCQVSLIDITSDDETIIRRQLAEAKVDLAFIALHGQFGEDGGIQEILERIGLPYTGSDARASRIAINKILTQGLLSEKGLRVPEYMLMEQNEKVGLDEVLAVVEDFPFVVKPSCEGSSIGVSIVTTAEEFAPAVQLAFRYGQEILVEKFIKGPEVTVGILEDKALPLVEVRPKNQFFDFTAKYQKGMTDYIVPAPLDSKLSAQIQQIALEAFHVVGCRDLARIDFIVNEQAQPYLLEVNTIPGFTATSLLPMAAKEIGIDFTEVCLRIARRASKRKMRVTI